MYNLGEIFKFDLNSSTANSKCIVKGNKYRFTVLTERLIRIEYSETGEFLDYPTQNIWYRNLEKPEFVVRQNEVELNIQTRYFELSYLKEKPIYGGKISPMKNLKIMLKNTDKIWYYKHPEARNYGYYAYIEKNKLKKVKSLYSMDGFATIDDSNSDILLENGTFKKRNNNNIDIYVFLYNKDFYFCLNDYFKITGLPQLLPRYAFGTMVSRNKYYNEYEIAHTIRKYEENNIPISMFILNNWEGLEYGLNPEYKELNNVISFLNEKNIKLGLNIKDISEISDKTNNYSYFKQYLEADKNGKIPFNLYDPRTIDAYLKLLIHPLDNIGVDFYFLDSYDLKNLDRLMILKHFLYKDKQIMNKRTIVTGYNDLSSLHRYSILYSGKQEVNFDALSNVLKFNSTASNMGLSYFSHDIGGTLGGIEDSELFIRFIQLGVFLPIFRLGADESEYYKREPWKWDISTYEITKKFMNLRYKLIPYIYTEAYKYHKYGKPIVEPIYYKYPGLYDDLLYINNYFFGSNFYISPISIKKDSIMNRVIHKLFIPEGIWYDYFTGKKYVGNKRYVSFYKDDEYPIFVKRGAIIPMSCNSDNDTSIPKKMEIQIFPGENNTYSIYEDDGISNNNINDYAITNIELMSKKDKYSLTILPIKGKASILPNTRDYKINFRNTKMSANVISYINGEKIIGKKRKENNDLIYEINDVPTNAQLTIICSGTNIEIDAIRIINDDITSIISDLPIKTVVKERIDKIMFSKVLPIKKKRIEIRKLANGRDYLEKKYIDLFLKLLEYISEV